MTSRAAPITVALIDDYDVVLLGVAHMLARYTDRVAIAEIDTTKPLRDTVDIALYDSFAQPASDQQEVAVLVRSGHARRVVVYTWRSDPPLIEAALAQGVDGYLSKTLAAADLVAALEAVHAGQVMVTDAPSSGRRPQSRVTGMSWPGRGEGLTEREAEVLALITQGKSNAEVAALTYLSPNTMKSYIRSVYRKIGVASRTQAVLWGIHHGFTPDHRRIEHWRAAS